MCGLGERRHRRPGHQGNTVVQMLGAPKPSSAREHRDLHLRNEELLPASKIIVPRKRVIERRRWPRLALAIPVFVHNADDQGNEILEFATILNVSAGGVLFASRKYLRQHSQVFLEIPIGLTAIHQARHVQRRFQARILRIVNMDRSYYCAARFNSPLK